METDANNSPIERETLQLVLEEFTQEQKTTNQQIAELTKAVHQSFSKIEEVQKEQTDKTEKGISEPPDIKSVEAILQKGFLDIKFMIGRQPKNIIRKFQILLFPEQDAKLFYKIVFGRWFLLLVIMVALNHFYNWGIHYSDNSKEIEMRQIQNDRIRKAWEYMYANSDKETKKIMQKAYINSVESN